MISIWLLVSLKVKILFSLSYCKILISIFCTVDVNSELFDVKAGDRIAVVLARYLIEFSSINPIILTTS